VSLRLKLLLLSLATLALPWEGCQYARKMEAALRAGEQQALAGTAQTLAAALQGRTDLLYRDVEGAESAPPGPLDLEPVLLATAPFIDGYADEWPHEPSAWRTVDHGPDQLRLLTGVHERMLYVLIEVRDAHVIFDAPDADPLDPQGFGDRVWLGFEDPEGSEHQVFIASAGPGPVRARRIEGREYGRQVAVDEPRINGAWQLMSGGYHIELRVPLSLLGGRLGVLVDNRDERGGAAASYGTLDRESLHARGRLILASPELGSYLTQFVQPGLRLTVTTPAGAPLGAADALAAPIDTGTDRGILARLYRRMLDRPGDRRLVEAAAPIFDADRQHAIGTMQVAQIATRWLPLRDRALSELLNLTLITSGLAVAVMLAFAGWLAWRLARLRRASESALTREGLVTSFPDTGARDELGDVARSFSTLLARLAEYTGYLRTLAGKLAHEIRTPLTIVRSSLENLESESLSASARAYLERAREGSDRLNAILVAMGAATRVEEAIQSAERARFDLTAVLASAIDSYRIAFPERRFAAELPAIPLEMEGAPDLIVQALDKLIDNAVDFSASGSTITVRLCAEDPEAVIEVENQGPPLAPESRDRLFESLWQSRSEADRTGTDGRPHFGLGLYIVRLIAEFHGGRAEAADLPDGDGVRFRVRLAR
jgi:signal transduction histidine kinase